VTSESSTPTGKLKVYRDSLIYVLCPSGIVTGGIEAVHQLVDKLRRFGHAAYIVPVPVVRNPQLLQYRNYDVAFSPVIIDHCRNILITTEVNPKALDDYRLIQKAIWWLSVDFHEALTEKFDFDKPSSSDVTHFVQSAYAAAYLRRKGVSRFDYLTDYLHAEYLKQSPRYRKTDVVLYTPVKGAQAYVQRLMAADRSIQWLALSGMIRKKHAATMRAGKVYVDFGTHPGKDRQPREAAVNGCCVIVGLVGAARFEEDVPIANQYKFELQPMDEQRVLTAISGCLSAYESRIDDFDQYAQIVRLDEQRFAEEVKFIFGLKANQRTWQVRIILGNIFRFVQLNSLATVLRGFVNELLPLHISEWVKGLYPSAADKRPAGRQR
jgi:hypothetical protein